MSRRIAIGAGLLTIATADEAEAKHSQEGAGLDQFQARVLHVCHAPVIYFHNTPIGSCPAAGLRRLRPSCLPTCPRACQTNITGSTNIEGRSTVARYMKTISAGAALQWL